jgi:hypothetical protein
MYKIIVGAIFGCTATASLVNAHTSSVRLHYLAYSFLLLMLLLAVGWVFGRRRGAPAQGATARTGWGPPQRQSR